MPREVAEMKQYSMAGRRIGSKIRRWLNSGSISVEMALVTPILLGLLFGIIEFGLIFKDVAILKQATREGARAAAVGANTAQIESQVTSNAATLDLENLQTELKYRVYSGGWTSWESASALGDTADGTENNATEGAQIRVHVAYAHHLISGRLFSRLADEPDGHIMTLTTSCIMRRE